MQHEIEMGRLLFAQPKRVHEEEDVKSYETHETYNRVVTRYVFVIANPTFYQNFCSLIPKA